MRFYGTKKPRVNDELDDLVATRMKRQTPPGETDPMTGAKAPPRGGGNVSMTPAGPRTPQQKPVAPPAPQAVVGLTDNVGVAGTVKSPILDAQKAPPADDGLDDLVKTRQEMEMQAKRDELAADKAKALAAGSRVAGLGGFGISGATAALQSDIAGQQNRDSILALEQLDREQADSAFQDIQRDATIDAYEEELGRDVDGDGDVGGVTEKFTPGQRPKDLEYDDPVAVARRRNYEEALSAFRASGFDRMALPVGDPASGTRVMSATDRNGNPIPGGAVYWDGERLFRAE